MSRCIFNSVRMIDHVVRDVIESRTKIAHLEIVEVEDVVELIVSLELEGIIPRREKYRSRAGVRQT